MVHMLLMKHKQPHSPWEGHADGRLVVMLHLCKGPSGEAQPRVATKLWDKSWEWGLARDSQSEEGVLLHTLLPDALGPLGLCGVKLVLLDFPVLQIVIRVVANLEPSAVVEELVDNGPRVVCGLGVGCKGVGSGVCSGSCKGVAYQFLLVVDGDAVIACTNLHKALIVQQLLHTTPHTHTLEGHSHNMWPLKWWPGCVSITVQLFVCHP